MPKSNWLLNQVCKSCIWPWIILDYFGKTLYACVHLTVNIVYKILYVFETIYIFIKRCQQCAATLCNTCDEDVHTVNALHDRQVKIMNHWADVAPLQGVDIDDKLDAVMGRSTCSELFCYEYILYFPTWVYSWMRLWADPHVDYLSSMNIGIFLCECNVGCSNGPLHM